MHVNLTKIPFYVNYHRYKQTVPTPDVPTFQKKFVCQNERIGTLKGVRAGRAPLFPLNPPRLFPDLLKILTEQTSTDLWK